MKKDKEDKLEEITDKNYGEVYSKVLKIDYVRLPSHNRYAIDLIRMVCTKSNFIPFEFIKYFQIHKKFTQKQIIYINGVYQRIKNYKKADKEYTSGDYREELIKLMKEVYATCLFSALKGRITGLKKGLIIYGKYFNITSNCINLIQGEKRKKFTDRLERLKEIYWQIYHKVKIYWEEEKSKK